MYYSFYYLPFYSSFPISWLLTECPYSSLQTFIPNYFHPLKYIYKHIYKFLIYIYCILLQISISDVLFKITHLRCIHAALANLHYYSWPLLRNSFCVYSTFFFFFFLIFNLEKVSGEGGRGKSTGRETNRFHAECRARCWAWYYDPRSLPELKPRIGLSHLGFPTFYFWCLW